MSAVLCQYFIQNDSTHGNSKVMNAYVLPKAYSSLREVTVEDVKKFFPMDHVKYHFRFLTKIKDMKVWVDTTRDSVAVPTIDGKIKIKLLRLPDHV